MSEYQNPCINCKQHIEMSDRNSGKWLPFNLDGTLHNCIEKPQNSIGTKKVKNDFFTGAKDLLRLERRTLDQGNESQTYMGIFYSTWRT